MLHLDHIAIAAETLEAGVAWVEKRLGVKMGPVGHHPQMGTHNRLLSLGPSEYLEVIAVDPEAVPPARPRWFDLDRFQGAPRVQNWITRTGQLEVACTAAPDGIGTPMALRRADFRWRMVVPEDGVLPFDGAYPALIQWDSGDPAPQLPDQNVRLTALCVIHPKATDLQARLGPQLKDARIRFETGANKELTAIFDTPNGQVQLG